MPKVYKYGAKDAEWMAWRPNGFLDMEDDIFDEYEKVLIFNRILTEEEQQRLLDYSRRFSQEFARKVNEITSH